MKQHLQHAEKQSRELFDLIERKGLIIPGKSERTLVEDVVKLARDHFGVEEFWHKKIVRTGINTLQPYSGNPPNRVIKNDDIVIVDFGPVFGGWEADYARTYVIGNAPLKMKIVRDVEDAWQEANEWYLRKSSLTGAQFFNYIVHLAKRYGYTYGGEIAGHIVGPYPHEQLGPGNPGLDIHPDNHQDMFSKDLQGENRNWILEMHFNDRNNKFGAYIEQLLG